jgi:hypothetical protein
MTDNDNKKLVIRPGDTVTIRSHGLVRTGVVHSASNYGNLPWSPEPCWYIEYEDPKYGAGYWKQDDDGGTVELVKVKEE